MSWKSLYKWCSSEIINNAVFEHAFNLGICAIMTHWASFIQFDTFYCRNAQDFISILSYFNRKIMIAECNNEFTEKHGNNNKTRYEIKPAILYET